MSVIEPEDKIALVQQMMQLEEKERKRVEKAFIPWLPGARPFAEQKNFFRDRTKTKLCRTGNRAAKTFSTHRDLAWKLMRNHPYRPDWREDYEKSKPKKFWCLGPTFEFLKEASWDTYLHKFIPPWYYTNDAGEQMIITKKHQGYEYIDKVIFRNGDQLEFKSYSQNILALMGRSIDVAVLDEMPPKLMVISEIVTRVLDKGGDMVMGFTPLNPDEDIKHYLDNHSSLALHTWPLLANPLYKNDPEKYQRVLDEWEHLPKAEREARLNGAWYYESDGTEQVFENIIPEVVEDFEVPLHWRQARVLDPASHVTGFSILAEDPNTGEWYVIHSGELYWKGKLAKAEDIEREIDRYRPTPDFKYCLNIYDNAEAWFSAHSSGIWRPCAEKNKQAQIIALRKIMQDRRLKFFRVGGAAALRQVYKYKQKDGKVLKKQDHIVDTLQYFARQIPPPRNADEEVPVGQEGMIKSHFDKLKKKWATHSVKEPEVRQNVRPMFYAGRFQQRRAR